MEKKGWKSQSINLSINLTILNKIFYQSINQTINQSMNRTIEQSINQSTDGLCGVWYCTCGRCSWRIFNRFAEFKRNLTPTWASGDFVLPQIFLPYIFPITISSSRIEAARPVSVPHGTAGGVTRKSSMWSPCRSHCVPGPLWSSVSAIVECLCLGEGGGGGDCMVEFKIESDVIQKVASWGCKWSDYFSRGGEEEDRGRFVHSQLRLQTFPCDVPRRRGRPGDPSTPSSRRMIHTWPRSWLIFIHHWGMSLFPIKPGNQRQFHIRVEITGPDCRDLSLSP